MRTSPIARTMLAGALAGACEAAVLALAVTALLGTGVLWQYAFSSSIPVLRDTAALAVIQDIGQLPSFLWSWRWIALALMAVGTTLAAVDHLAGRLPADVRAHAPNAALLWMVVAGVVGALLSSSDAFLFSGVDRSATLPAFAASRFSGWNMLAVGVMVALVLAGVTWMAWSWWYAHWRGWLGMRAAPAPVEAPQDSPDAWFARQQERGRAVRAALGLALAAAALTALAMAGYDAVRTTVRSGDLWAVTDTPRSEVRLALGAAERRLLVENTFGRGGAASVALLRVDGGAAAGPVAVAFESEGLGSDRTQIDVAGLPEGEYVLRAELSDGGGGRVGYALLQSGGPLVPLAAALAGFCAGATLAASLLLLGILRGRSGA